MNSDFFCTQEEDFGIRLCILDIVACYYCIKKWSKSKLIKNEYSGLKVSSRSIRTVDGVRGVYVVSGIEIKFVEVEILFSNEEYAICKLNTSDGSKLRLYDEVVVKGRGLYDGKSIY